MKRRQEFVIDLLHSVFKKSAADTTRLLEKIDKYGQAICGTYPRERANKLLAAARRRIRAAGHSLLITSEAVAEDGDAARRALQALRHAFRREPAFTEGAVALICDDCLYEISRTLPEVAATKQFESACDALDWHFAGIPHDRAGRDLAAVPRSHARGRSRSRSTGCSRHRRSRFFGIHEQHRYETLTISRR